jgi:hypothetical protein
MGDPRPKRTQLLARHPAFPRSSLLYRGQCQARSDDYMLSPSCAPADDPEAFPRGGCGVRAVRQVDAAQPSTTAQKGGFGVRAPAPQSIRRRSIFIGQGFVPQTTFSGASLRIAFTLVIVLAGKFACLPAAPNGTALCQSLHMIAAVFFGLRSAQPPYGPHASEPTPQWRLLHPSSSCTRA